MEQCAAATSTAMARRRRFGRRRRLANGAPAAGPAAPAVTLDPLHVTVRHDGRSAAIVTVTGLLVRQHALRLDEWLAAAFGDLRTRYVIDLGGVTCLDPTTLAAVTGYAERARRLGARVTIVPPGARRPVAA